MPVARISGEGLIAMAFAVLMLWACLLGERALTRQAYAERVQVMRDVRHFPRPIPVSYPRRPAGVKSHQG